jgi:hypothetical protein
VDKVHILLLHYFSNYVIRYIGCLNISSPYSRSSISVYLIFIISLWSFTDTNSVHYPSTRSWLTNLWKIEHAVSVTWLGKIQLDWLDLTHAVWQKYTEILWKINRSNIAASSWVRLTSTRLDYSISVSAASQYPTVGGWYYSTLHT